MLTIFSRALLLADIPQAELIRAKNKLKNAGIFFEYKTKTTRSAGRLFKQKQNELYAVYVRKCDYTQAKKVMERG